MCRWTTWMIHFQSNHANAELNSNVCEPVLCDERKLGTENGILLTVEDISYPTSSLLNDWLQSLHSLTSSFCQKNRKWLEKIASDSFPLFARLIFACLKVLLDGDLGKKRRNEIQSAWNQKFMQI